ncbi:NAD-dependent epimerase/dehydratase family protein [Aequorivita xiaoshiensis]|uniref:NAD-dependent epimerase/dehydratase family protein n=1 Tax=Aequorivita xiaoshiensis TaxID=2874476 RepID=A0A9X1R0G0_9FLAO|nr:NAD-dependent epimerase/dehydratase family protein [Aequorivita xiaoshiensis]MCG2429647.1 NAD-dependent epimerase/dehydratase family protein [Aequorivita xiaoshiensis]
MILVTGGTGLVGSHLLYFLLQENEKVRAIHRAKSDLNSVKKIFSLYTSEADSLYNKIEWVEANVNDIPALTEAFKNITRVYHCAAIISFDSSEYKLLKKVNIEGTANIVNLSLANDVKKLCYVSSVSTLVSNIIDSFISEETPWNSDEKNSVYAITKYGAEMEVWRGTQEGLDAVIVNPGVILGTSPNNDGSGVIVGLGAKGIPFYPSGSMGIVDIKDVVRAMIFLMNSAVKNEQYIVVGKNITFKELLSKLAVLFEKKPPTKKLSKGIMLFISGIDWLLNKLFNTKRKVVKANVLSMFTNTAYNTDKLRDQFDFKYTPTDETLKRIVTEIKQASI